MKQRKIVVTITKRDEPSLDMYLHDISKISLLSIEQEVKICELIKKGDEEAVNNLIKSNLRFVVSVAKQFQHKGLFLGDLINEGNIGLIKSAAKFDETKGFRFISFAVYWIRQSLMQAVAEQTRTVKLPFNQIYAISQINKAIAVLEQILLRHPTVNEIAEHMGWEECKVDDLLCNAKKGVSLDQSLNMDDEYSLVETLRDEAAAPDHTLIADSLTQNLLHLVNTLPKKEARVVILYMGLGQQHAMQLDDIATIMGLSKERVRQLKDKALKELKRRGKPFLSKLGIVNSNI